MIEVANLTKRYGNTLAVDDVTFRVQPGTVTGFLGPNGAGKSTTMRMILGLARPNAGSVRVNGRSPGSHGAPLREVGGLLEANIAHPGRSARDHLWALAASNGIDVRRVDEVLEIVDLPAVAHKRVGTFSMGMRQRLGIATALLGNPATVVLDEPVNGLDPEGIIWLRGLLRDLAAEGRTVFVSSHLLNELAETAQHVVVILGGRLAADLPLTDLLAAVSARNRVTVRSPESARLRAILGGPEVTITSNVNGALEIHGLTSVEIGDAAAGAGIAIHELVQPPASLEDAFMELIRTDLEQGVQPVVGDQAL